MLDFSTAEEDATDIAIRAGRSDPDPSKERRPGPAAVRREELGRSSETRCWQGRRLMAGRSQRRIADIQLGDSKTNLRRAVDHFPKDIEIYWAASVTP